MGETTANASQDDKDLMATPSQFDKYGLTLVRTIAHIFCRPETPSAVVGLQAVDFGIAVIEQDAYAALALPDLNFGDDQPGRGWVWRHRMWIEDHTSSGAVPQAQRVSVDLKSKRKINDMELVFIINNNSVTGTAFSSRTEGLIRQVFLR